MSPSRRTNFVFTGSFWPASRSASRASGSETPASSNITRPGLTTATQPSGEPFPLPMRVSAGFFVIGLSGKMLIQTLPPRLILRVIAMRAASIWRFVTHPLSSALIPKSPNCTAAWPLVSPVRRPRCAFRNFVFFGISIRGYPCSPVSSVRADPSTCGSGPTAGSPPSAAPACSSARGGSALSGRGGRRCPGRPPGRPPAPHRAEALPVLGARPGALARGAEPLGDAAAPAGRVLLAEAKLLPPAGDAAVALGHDLALVDPDLDADPARRRPRLGEAVVDVGPDRVQRHAPFRVLLGAAHLGAAEPARAAHLHARGAGADRGGERALHRAPERHPVLELLGDRLGDELRVELGPLDLVDVDVHVLGGHGVDLLAERVHLDARLPDHDPRPRGVDVDRDPLLVLPDQDVRQPGVRELAQDVLPDPHILVEGGRELLLADHPVRLPVVDDADAQAAGMDLLSHYALPLSAPARSARSTRTVMWQVRFRIRFTRPRARGRQRLSLGPSSTKTAET